MIKGHPEDFVRDMMERLFHYIPPGSEQIAKSILMTKISIATTVAATGVTVYGQMQQAEAAEATARYNAELKRYEQDQKNDAREIEKVQDKKRFYLQQEKSANQDMSLDFLYADLEAFEYQALIKDYNVAVGNTTLEGQARGDLYEGQVRSQQASTKAAGSLLGGTGKAATQYSDMSMIGEKG